MATTAQCFAYGAAAKRASASETRRRSSHDVVVDDHEPRPGPLEKDFCRVRSLALRLRHDHHPSPPRGLQRSFGALGGPHASSSEPRLLPVPDGCHFSGCLLVKRARPCPRPPKTLHTCAHDTEAFTTGLSRPPAKCHYRLAGKPPWPPLGLPGVGSRTNTGEPLNFSASIACARVTDGTDPRPLLAPPHDEHDLHAGCSSPPSRFSRKPAS
ncbi:hypothetical protein GQ53DRAFT_549581 [Thozetella sp. PMI_491]|nr:hypothetical protein GQ53DRAFT_549581 [Thozetella sp. PMI_491]